MYIAECMKINWWMSAGGPMLKHMYVCVNVSRLYGGWVLVD